MPANFDSLLKAFLGRVARIGGPEVEPFRADMAEAGPPRQLAAKGLACLRHLDRLLAIAPDAERPLIEILAKHRLTLQWGQTYTAADFGADFIDNYGWLEVLGPRGHFSCDRVAAGLLILGPGIHYPDHHHVAEEIYVPLSGTADWRKGDGPFVARAPGETIHHPSNVSHAMRTGSEPLLALYLWRGGPLAQRSVVTGQVRA